jgi:hypothetical protein
MQLHRELHHDEAFRDHLAPPSHPCQVMACIGMVALNRVRVCFADHMLRWRQNGTVGRPVIGIVYPPRPFYPFIEAAEGGSITTTDDPGDNSPCMTVQGFPEPASVFFDPI